MEKFNLVVLSGSQERKEKKRSQQELADCADVTSLEHLEMKAGSVSAE